MQPLIEWNKRFPVSQRELIEAKLSPQSTEGLAWCLMHGRIPEPEYLEWAMNVYELPAITGDFFTTAADNGFWEKHKGLYRWSPHFFPVGEWEGVVMIACLEPKLDFKLNIPFCFALASARNLALLWNTLNPPTTLATLLAEPEPIAAAPVPGNTTQPKLEVPENLVIPTSSVVSRPKPRGPEGMVVKTSRSLEDAATDPYADTAVLRKRASEDAVPEGLSATFKPPVTPKDSESANLPPIPEGLEGLSSVHIKAKPQLASTNPGLTSLKINTAMNPNKPAAKTPANETPKAAVAKAPEKPVEEDVHDLMDGSFIGQTPDLGDEAGDGIAQTQVTQYGEVEAGAENSESVQAAPASAAASDNTSSTGTGSSSNLSQASVSYRTLESATNVSDLCAVALASVLRLFEGAMILFYKEGDLVPTRWSDLLTNSANESMPSLSLDSPSIFRIVATTYMPFHGRIAKSTINDRFMESFLNGQYPAHVTIVPVIANKDLAAMILGVSRTPISFQGTLSNMQQIAGEMASAMANLQDSSRVGA